MEPRGVLADLEARFAGSIRRRDSELASDLALSFLQDADLQRSLTRRGGWAVETAFGRRRLAEVGPDHVMTEDEILVPLTDLIAVPTGGRAEPVLRRAPLVFRLRQWARAGRRVEVLIGDLHLRGVLQLACRDHLWIGEKAASTVVALAAIRAIRPLSHGN